AGRPRLAAAPNVVVEFTDHATVLFFFSSRRRHTRFSRDWSSDVCSSDLPHAEILTFVKDNLAKEAGLELEVKEFTDYVTPNTARSEERRVGKECRSGWCAED